MRSAQVWESRSGRQCYIAIIGDALLEPFWPEGLGLNRGFHTYLDAVRCPGWT